MKSDVHVTPALAADLLLIEGDAIFQCMANVEETLARFRYVIAEQTKALNEQRAEIERLQMVIAQSADAMTCLQAIYTDPNIKAGIRAAAAKAVLPHQHPKVTVLGYANMTSLARRLDE